jgi:predicted DNA-binding transcriptional regulator YafY
LAGEPTSRPALVRLQRILARIRRNDHPNASTIAREFECSARTIQRDIECLRDSLGAPIEWDPQRRGYRIDPNFSLPGPKMTAADLAAFLVAERAVEALGPGPLAASMRAAREKLARALPEEIRLTANDQAALVDYRSTAPAFVRDEVFAALSRAAAEGRRVRIAYRSATRGGARSRREIDPYGLVTQDGSLYVLAWCHLRRGILCFAASRIDSIAETGETFQRPADFSVKKHMDGAFRTFVGDRLVAVKVWFSPRAALYLEERPWHPSQRIERHRDGSIHAHFQISYPDEWIRWVLSWGPDAEVLGPKEVRARARELIQETIRRYRGPSAQNDGEKRRRRESVSARRKSGARQFLS